MLDVALDQALVLAFRHLGRRDRTCQEMREHLAGRGIEPDVAEAAVGELIQQGYLDDVRFARIFAEDKRGLEQWGSERIRRDLIRRGIATELIGPALEDGSEGDELERALAVLRRRFPALPRDRRDRDRAIAVLLRKGYGYEVARRAVSEHREEEDGGLLPPVG